MARAPKPPLPPAAQITAADPRPIQEAPDDGVIVDQRPATAPLQLAANRRFA